MPEHSLPDDGAPPRIRVTVLDVEPGPARDRGLRDVYLREILLQCRFALSALEAALSGVATKGDAGEEVWSAVQSSLAAAAVVSRLLAGDDIRGDQAAKQFGRDRGEKLRRALGVQDDSPILDRRLRNHLDHVDQRLDDLARDDRTAVIIDRFITDGVRPVLFHDQTHSEEASLSLLR